jgi:hypothetical protein
LQIGLGAEIHLQLATCNLRPSFPPLQASGVKPMTMSDLAASSPVAEPGFLEL